MLIGLLVRQSGWVSAAEDEIVHEYEETKETLDAAYAANPNAKQKLNTYLGSKVDMVRWLKSHEHDTYYLGTEFYWGPIDGPALTRPYGEYGKNSGMNCVGFVASVMRAVDADLSRITSRLYGGYANASNWNDTVAYNNIQSYRYKSVEAMLKGGKLEKGDIVYFEPDWKEEKDDCHIGIFWGDTPYEDRFWHSTLLYNNAITHIHTGTDYEYVYIFKTQKYGSLRLKVTASEVTHCVDNVEKPSMKGTVYTLYDSKGKAVRDLKLNAKGQITFHDIEVGNYTLKQTKAADGYIKSTKSYTVTITNGNITTKSLTMKPKVVHEVETDAAVKATCEVTGRTKGSHCAVCGKTIVKQKVTAAKGHAWRYTDNQDGTHTVSCTRCKYKVITGHMYTKGVCACGLRKSDAGKGYKEHEHIKVVDPKIAANCVREGWTKGSHCSICGITLEEQQKIAKTGHVYKKTYTVDIPAGFQTEGCQSKHCKVCDSPGETVKTIPIIKTVKVSYSRIADNGTVLGLKATIKNENGSKLKEGKDYTLSYIGKGKRVGSRKVKVTLTGKYAGSRIVYLDE